MGQGCDRSARSGIRSIVGPTACLGAVCRNHPDSMAWPSGKIHATARTGQSYADKTGAMEGCVPSSTRLSSSAVRSIRQLEGEVVRFFLDRGLQLRGFDELILARDQVLGLRGGLADLILAASPAILGDRFRDFGVIHIFGCNDHP